MTEKNCFKCFTSNPVDANYCKQCGANLTAPHLTKTDPSDALIIVGLSIIIFTNIIWFLVPILIEDWYELMRLPRVIISLMGSIALVLIALAIKNKAAKIIFIIFGLILTISSFISDINFYFSQF